MKIPNITGKNRIRDAAICVEYGQWHDSKMPAHEREIDFVRRVAARHGLTERRIWQIVQKNRDFILDTHAETFKQIHRIKRQIAKAPETLRDVLEWEHLLNSKLAEKSKSGSDPVGRGDTRVIIIRETQVPAPNNRITGVVDGDPNQGGALPRSLSVVRV
jgi:hypothetical protein